MSDILAVYKPLLPKYLVNFIDIYKVERKYRKNKLSHIPGGTDVIVVYHDGKAPLYDWIKMPSKYIRSFFGGIVNMSEDQFNSLIEQEQLKVSKKLIASIYARKYKNDEEFKSVGFEKIWDSAESTEMPWECLKRFDESFAGPPRFNPDLGK